MYPTAPATTALTKAGSTQLARAGAGAAGGAAMARGTAREGLVSPVGGFESVLSFASAGGGVLATLIVGGGGAGAVWRGGGGNVRSAPAFGGGGTLEERPVDSSSSTGGTTTRSRSETSSPS